MRTARLALIVLGLLTACKSSRARYEEGAAAIDAEYAPKLEALEKHVAAVYQKAQKKPALRPLDEVTPPLDANNTVEGESNAAIWAHDAQICDAKLPDDAPFAFGRGHAFCIARLPKVQQVGIEKLDARQVDEALARHRKHRKGAVGLRYVLFVETLAFKAPRLSGADTFQPGMFKGAVRVFDAKTEEYLGGFEVEARSDSTIGLSKHQQGKSALIRDLKDNLDKALGAALTKATGVDTKVQATSNDHAFD